MLCAADLKGAVQKQQALDPQAKPLCAETSVSAYINIHVYISRLYMIRYIAIKYIT